MTILGMSDQERFRYEIEQTKPLMHVAFLSKPRKRFPILDECFLALNLLNNSCFIPGLCLQENSSRANTVQDDLTSTGGLTQQLLCVQERTESFYLFPKIKHSR